MVWSMPLGMWLRRATDPLGPSHRPHRAAFPTHNGEVPAKTPARVPTACTGLRASASGGHPPPCGPTLRLAERSLSQPAGRPCGEQVQQRTHRHRPLIKDFVAHVRSGHGRLSCSRGPRISPCRAYPPTGCSSRGPIVTTCQAIASPPPLSCSILCRHNRQARGARSPVQGRTKGKGIVPHARLHDPSKQAECHQGCA